MENVFYLSQPRFIVTSNELLPKLQEWVTDVDLSRIILLDVHQSQSLGLGPPNQAPVSSISVRSMLRHGELDWMRLAGEKEVKETPAAYFLTSGTTGCPKLAVLSHYSMVAHFSQIHQEVPYEVVRLGCLPLFHMFGGAWALALTVRHGQPLYIMPRFVIDNFLKYTDMYTITETLLAPPIVTRLVELGSYTAAPLKSLRFVGVGGAPITAAAMRTFKSALHEEATLSGIYGATEVGTVCMLRYGDEDYHGCVGKPLPGVRICIRQHQKRDAASEPSHEDGIGEIVVSAQSHMIQYRSNTDDCDVDVDRYRTGDLGCVKEGRLYIMGKAKDIMKVNGQVRHFARSARTSHGWANCWSAFKYHQLRSKQCFLHIRTSVTALSPR